MRLAAMFSLSSASAFLTCNSRSIANAAATCTKLSGRNNASIEAKHSIPDSFCSEAETIWLLEVDCVSGRCGIGDGTGECAVTEPDGPSNLCSFVPASLVRVDASAPLSFHTAAK